MKESSIAPSATERFRAVRDGSFQAAFYGDETADDLEMADPRNLYHRDRALARAQEKGEKVKLFLQLALLDVDFALALLEAERDIVEIAAARSRRETRAA